jgi:hypothetical protein
MLAIAANAHFFFSPREKQLTCQIEITYSIPMANVSQLTVGDVYIIEIDRVIYNGRE